MEFFVKINDQEIVGREIVSIFRRWKNISLKKNLRDLWENRRYIPQHLSSMISPSDEKFCDIFYENTEMDSLEQRYLDSFLVTREPTGNRSQIIQLKNDCLIEIHLKNEPYKTSKEISYFPPYTHLICSPQNYQSSLVLSAKNNTIVDYRGESTYSSIFLVPRKHFFDLSINISYFRGLPGFRRKMHIFENTVELKIKTDSRLLNKS